MNGYAVETVQQYQTGPWFSKRKSGLLSISTECAEIQRMVGNGRRTLHGAC